MASANVRDPVERESQSQKVPFPFVFLWLVWTGLALSLIFRIRQCSGPAQFFLECLIKIAQDVFMATIVSLMSLKKHHAIFSTVGFV